MFQTEQDLVNHLASHFRKRYFALPEIGVGYGISDLLVVRNKKALMSFIDTRNGRFLKYLDEVKVLDFIRRHNGVSLDDINEKTYISKYRLKYSVLSHLKAVEAIDIRNDKIYQNPNFALFPLLSTAIEAKLDDWNKGLAQALRYQRFAQKSYLALDAEYIHRVDKEQLIKYNIGLLSVGESVKEVLSPLQRRPSDPIMQYMASEVIISRFND